MVPDVTTLAPLLRGFAPPPLHDVTFAAKVSDKGGPPPDDKGGPPPDDKSGPLPDISALTLHVGASDLGAQVAGLTLNHLDVAAAAADQPVKADAVGPAWRSAICLCRDHRTADPRCCRIRMPRHIPVDATLQVYGATVAAKGTIANAEALTGANIVLAAQIPDLSALSPSGEASSAVGEADIVSGHAIRCRRRLSRRRLAACHVSDERRWRSVRRRRDWSEQEGLFDCKTAVQSHRPGCSASRARPDAGRGAPHIAPAPPDAKPPPRSKRSERLFSDQPIPFDLLRIADADLNSGHCRSSQRRHRL